MTILRVFEQVGGDKALAGKFLGISRATLYRKLKLYGIPLKAAEKTGARIRYSLIATKFAHRNLHCFLSDGLHSPYHDYSHLSAHNCHNFSEQYCTYLSVIDFNHA